MHVGAVPSCSWFPTVFCGPALDYISPPPPGFSILPAIEPYFYTTGNWTSGSNPAVTAMVTRMSFG